MIVCHRGAVVLSLLGWGLGGAYVGGFGAMLLQADAESYGERTLDDQGGGAITIDGISLKNMEEAQKFVRQEQMEKFAAVLGAPSAMMLTIPSPALIGVTTAAAGALGATGRMLKDRVVGRKELTELKAFSFPALGAFSGIFVLAVAYVVPAALTVEVAPTRPIAIVALSLIGGFAADDVLRLLWERIKAVLGGS